jgi:hypothetical protein
MGQFATFEEIGNAQFGLENFVPPYHWMTSFENGKWSKSLKKHKKLGSLESKLYQLLFGQFGGSYKWWKEMLIPLIVVVFKIACLLLFQ